MQMIRNVFGNCRKQMQRALRQTAVALPVIVGFAIAAAISAHSQTQKASTNSPSYEYEVASFKPIKPGTGDTSWAGMRFTPDGFSAHRESLRGLIQTAYGVQNYQISGSPEWLDSEIYDIDAKMDGAAADALQKLTQDERSLTLNRMLQALLADRLKLAIHRETKELPAYLLVVAKNGPKLHEAKSDDTYANGVKDIDGTPSGAGTIQTIMTQRSETMKAQATPMAGLARILATRLHRPVLDKTGLAGNYDFTLKFAPENLQLQSGPGSPPETDVPFLLDAIQQQLGLKLETGKGPVEVIVIDHVERPSGN
jgi:uncharacterized protein (TIGR03435 family)